MVSENPSPNPLRMQSRNISKSGMGLETAALEIDGVNLLSGPPCARENRLLLKIELEPAQPPVVAIGEVRWYDVIRGESAGLYQVGIEFIELRGNGKDRLSAFLKGHRTGEGSFRRLIRKVLPLRSVPRK
jgi:hypothetical protein